MRLLMLEGPTNTTDAVLKAFADSGHGICRVKTLEQAKRSEWAEPFHAVLIVADSLRAEGPQFCRWVRESLGDDLPIIVLVEDRSRLGTADAYLEHGADELIEWPVDAEAIGARIEFARRYVESQIFEDLSFRRLLEAAPDPIIVVDSSGRIIVASAQIEHMTGYRQHELIAQPIEILVPEEAREAHREHRHNYADHPLDAKLEMTARRKDGTTFPVEISLSPFDSDNGVNTIASVRDITERVRIETELRTSDERLRMALSAAHMGTWDWDLVSGVLTWSDETERLAGKSPGVNTYTYADFMEVIHPDDRARVDASVQEILQQGVEYREIYRVLRPDGGFIWSQAVGQLQRDASGRPIRLVGVANDITTRKEAEDALREGEERFRGAFEHAAIGMALVRTDGSFLRVNPALCQILGFDEEDLLEKSFQEITYPDDLDDDIAHVRKMLSGEIETYQLEKRYIRKDGDIVWSQLSVTLVHDAAGAPLYFVSQIEDVTERKRTEAALKDAYAEIDRVINAVTDCLYSAEMMPGGEYKYIFLSSVAEKLLGLPASLFIENADHWMDVIHPDDLEVVRQAFKRIHSSEDKEIVTEIRVIWPDGSLHWLLDRVVVTRREDGMFRFDGVLTDITERKQFENELGHRAVHDALTGLPNRMLFNDRLSHALVRRQRQSGAIAVFFLDLDNFKTVNDGLGHEAGDELLTAVAARLQSQIRPEDTLARFGGDEFVVLAEEVDSPRHAVTIAERLIEAMSEPISIAGRQVYTGVSIGIALSGDALTNPNEMLRNADAALYRAKASGRGRYVMFDPQMSLDALAKLEMEDSLRQALETNTGLVLHYQPIIEMAGGEMIALEALVRWQHPDGALIGPDTFIPLAEETGLIAALENWVLSEGCRQFMAWDLAFPYFNSIHLSINLSPRRCRESGVVEQIINVMSGAGIETNRLTLEITESVLVDEEAHLTLAALKAAGIRLAIDDFGTGYSSLGYLSRIAIDFLKIDRQFIAGMMEYKQRAAIVEAIVALGHSLGPRVTAEGIETPEQLHELRRLGCDHGQGYLLGRAVPANEFAEQLANGTMLKPIADPSAVFALV